MFTPLQKPKGPTCECRCKNTKEKCKKEWTTFFKNYEKYEYTKKRNLETKKTIVSVIKNIMTIPLSLVPGSYFILFPRKTCKDIASLTNAIAKWYLF